MNKLTKKFLNACDEVGLKRVVIGVAHPLVPESQTFVFGPQYSVFGLKRKGSQTHDFDGWPAIWAAVSRAGISGGAGNSNQHQIEPKFMAELEKGAYQRINGEWRKV